MSFSAGSGYIELTVAVGSDAEPGVTVLTAEALTVRTTQDTLETAGQGSSRRGRLSHRGMRRQERGAVMARRRGPSEIM